MITNLAHYTNSRAPAWTFNVDAQVNQSFLPKCQYFWNYMTGHKASFSGFSNDRNIVKRVNKRSLSVI